MIFSQQKQWPGTVARIFVSYAREDLEKVSPYIADMQEAGFKVWWDLELLGGDDWSESIETELARSDCVVIFWSEHSVNSPWVRIEAHYAKQHHCLVPVRIDSVDIPDEYRALQTIDATQQDTGKVVAAIRTAIAAIFRKSRQTLLRRLAAATVAAVALTAAYQYLDIRPNLQRSTGEQLELPPAWKELQQAVTLEEIGLVETRFKALKADDPGSELAHAGLCATYLRRYALSKRDTDLALAQRSCATVTELDQDSALSAEARGWLAYFTGDYPEAVGLLQRAISIDGSAATARIGLARALEAQGALQEAEQSLREATVAQPGLWRTHNALALFLQGQGRYPESVQRFELALELAPRNSSILNNIGVSHLFMQDYGQAISAWSKVLEFTPEQDHGATLSNIGSAYYLMRDFASARIAFEKASRLSGDDYSAWGNLADTLAAMKDLEAARSSYRRALDRAQLILEQNPGELYAVAAAASFKSALGLQGWEEDIAKSLAEQPGDPEIRRLAVLCYLRAGQHDLARRQYAELLNLGFPEFILEGDYQFDTLTKTPVVDQGS